MNFLDLKILFCANTCPTDTDQYYFIRWWRPLPQNGWPHLTFLSITLLGSDTSCIHPLPAPSSQNNTFADFYYRQLFLLLFQLYHYCKCLVLSEQLFFATLCSRQVVRVIQVVTMIQVVGGISLDALHSENKIAIKLFRKSCHAGDTYTDKWPQRNKNSIWSRPSSQKRFITQMHIQQLTFT